MNAPGQVILVGAFSEIVELCEAAGIGIAALIENRPDAESFGLPITGTDAEAAAILAAHPGVPVFVTPDRPALRAQLTEHYLALGAQLATLVHPRAFVARSARLGFGCVAQAGALVSSNSVLGVGVKLNTGANVTHDVTVGDFTSVAPGAVLLGRGRVGARAYIGANATILPGCAVGDGAVVGAGCVVTGDVPPGAVVAGNPGRAR